MLRIDKRKGSGELEKHFKAYGIQPQMAMLDFGDFDFDGSGPGDIGCAVVIERKQIDDLVASMKSKRLSGHQLPGMSENYDYGYLMVEGLWRPGDSGELEVWRNGKNSGWEAQGLLYSGILGYINTLIICAGMAYIRTCSEKDTVASVVELYKWWSKPYSSHKSHDAVYAPVNVSTAWEGGKFTLTPRKVSTAEEMASRLPGFMHKARYVVEKFGSVADFARAGVPAWTGLVWVDSKGNKKKISKATAEKVVAVLRDKNGKAAEELGPEIEKELGE